MRIRTIAYLGHKRHVLFTIRKHGPNQSLNQQISMLASSALAGGIPLDPSGVFRTRTLVVTVTHRDKQPAKSSLAVPP